MFMMHKVSNSKQKINFSSEDLLLSLNYSNKIFIDKLVALNSNFNFLNNKNNDLLKIKLENKFIPNNQTNINNVF